MDSVKNINTLQLNTKKSKTKIFRKLLHYKKRIFASHDIQGEYEDTLEPDTKTVVKSGAWFTRQTQFDYKYFFLKTTSFAAIIKANGDIVQLNQMLKEKLTNNNHSGNFFKDYFTTKQSELFTASFKALVAGYNVIFTVLISSKSTTRNYYFLKLITISNNDS